jgi:hypothetical protein
VKKYLAHLLVLGGFVVLLAGAAVAQDEIEPAARVNIPFAFHAGSVNLPAGVYTFDVDAVDHAVTVEQDATGRAFFVTGFPADPEQNGKPLLTFKNMGGEYTLEELQADSVGVGFAPVSTSNVRSYGTH